MIEQFNRAQFEAALPNTERYRSHYEGVINGEHCYSVAVGDKAKVFIRSSIDYTGIAASTGEDSIRTYLVDASNKPFASKVTKWTTRKKGWQERMLANIRFLIRAHHIAGLDQVGQPIPILKVVKEGENKGRFFCNIPAFRWITDPSGNFIS